MNTILDFIFHVFAAKGEKTIDVSPKSKYFNTILKVGVYVLLFIIMGIIGDTLFF